jgi:hypothetical protein
MAEETIDQTAALSNTSIARRRFVPRFNLKMYCIQLPYKQLLLFISLDRTKRQQQPDALRESNGPDSKSGFIPALLENISRMTAFIFGKT